MSAQPLFFGPAQAPLFGWLHHSSAPSELGAVVCAPLGQEMSNSYRTQQALAQAMAAQGLPTLRMDYAGCGNASDPVVDADLGSEGELPHWQDSVAQAIDHLRASAGVRRVVVVAMRAGVLIAAPVALQHAAVSALVALAPVASGRRLLREWRAMSSTAALQSGRDDGTLEVAGTAFSAATCAQLAGLDLSRQTWPAGKALHIIDREDLPGAGQWLARLTADATPFSAESHAGLGDMLLEAQHQRVPAQAVESVVDFALAHAAHPGHPSRATPANAQHQTAWRPPQCREAPAWAAVAADVQESVQWIESGRGSRLFAILSQASEATAALRRAAHGQAPNGDALQHARLAPPLQPHTVLLPNTGPVHHIGGHRLYVMLARRLAADGHRVLRLDLSGLGDSPARPGEPPDTVYGRRAVDDLGLALQMVQQRWPAEPVAVLGLCSGAYHALRLVVDRPGVAQAFIINPLVYHWREGMTLQDHELQLQAAYYGGKWRRWESWQRLLSGRSDLRLLARVAGERLLAAMRGWRRPADDRSGEGGDRIQGPAADLASDLLAAAAHGTALRFMFAQGEPGWPALLDQAGAQLQGLQDGRRASVTHLSPGDHTFTTEASRELLMAAVAQALGGGLMSSGLARPAASAAPTAAVQHPAQPAAWPAPVD